MFLFSCSKYLAIPIYIFRFVKNFIDIIVDNRCLLRILRHIRKELLQALYFIDIIVTIVSNLFIKNFKYHIISI